MWIKVIKWNWVHNCKLNAQHLSGLPTTLWQVSHQGVVYPDILLQELNDAINPMNSRSSLVPQAETGWTAKIFHRVSLLAIRFLFLFTSFNFSF
jgi:hypothetical protein